jgi:hypothetical protein
MTSNPVRDRSFSNSGTISAKKSPAPGAAAGFR